jgi:DNA polymerase-3 subunit delta'
MTMEGGHTSWPVVGHAQSINRLRQMVSRNRVPTALLFAGPEMTGRKTVALEFSRVLLCPDASDAVACGECSSCRRVTSGNHPDIDRWGIDRQEAVKGVSKSGTLTIESVRAIAGSATQRPHESERRVVIVDNAETLGEDAQQALLKTLEDAPAFTSIILIATTVESIISTVRSRVVEVPFQLVPSPVIAAGLKALRLDVDADLIAQLAQGRAGWAVAAASDSSVVERMRDETALVEQWIAASRRDRLVEAYRRGDSVVQKRASVQDVRKTLDLATLVWRDLLLSASGNENLAFDPDRAQRLLGSARPGTGDIYQALVACRQCQFDLQHNVRPKLALELMVNQWPILS